jgi:hypothetical protein
MNRKALKLSLVAFGCMSVGFAGGALATTKMKKEFVLVPGGTAKYVPSNPQDPEHSPQISFLQGDPGKGPVAFLLKTRGAAPLHWHSSDYWAVTLEGTTKHWPLGKDAEAKENPPGTFWYQPGGDASTAHTDVCVTDTGCTIFVVMTGKNDFVPVASK